MQQYSHSDNDTQVTNALGHTTINTSSTEILGATTVVQGLATPSCLATSSTRSYTAPEGMPEGFLYENVERNGSRTVYTRDAKGRVLTKTEDADGAVPRVTSYTWTSDSKLPASRATGEMSESFTYDAEGQLTSYSQTDVLTGSPSNGQTRSWTYSYQTLASGLKVLQSLDGPGLATNGVQDITSYTYNTDGSIATVTDPNGLVTSYQNYNALGLAERIVQPDGVVWALTYDALGRVLRAVENADNTPWNYQEFTYDAEGKILTFKDGPWNSLTFTYDTARRLEKVTEKHGEEIRYTYDAMGNVTRTEYRASSGAIRYFAENTFDELGRLKDLLGANGQTSSFTYDVEDNLDTATDANGNITDNSYDALNRLTSVLDRNNLAQTSMEHNEADQLTRYTDPRTIETRFVYNGFGEVVQEVSADRGTISYSHDTRSLVTSMTDGRGVTSTYAYDHGGRLISRNFPSAPAENQSFSYRTAGNSHAGRLAQISDETGTITRSYSKGYLTRERRRIENRDYDIDHSFGDQGELKQIRTPGQLIIRYTRDSKLRVTGITAQRWIKDPETGTEPPAQTIVSNVQYLPFGPISSLTYGDGAVQTREFDTSYRLARQLDQLGGTLLRDTTYGWTTRDNLASASNALDATKSESFLYSAQERLSRATGPYGQIDFDYDLVGNRISRSLDLNGQVESDTYSYPVNSNRLQSVARGGGSRALGYDGAGNVISDNLDGSLYAYSYNAANRLSGFAVAGQPEAEYVYNALGQQVIRRLLPEGKTLHVIHDLHGNRLAEYEFDPVTRNRTLLREYIWLENMPVAVVENDQIYFIRADHIGRPVFATDNTGTKIWEASYLPFGGMHVSTGASIDLRFPGQWFQAENELHQNWMRDYDPTLGRYIQADPLGLVDGPSVYGYALQNPQRYVDPKGLYVLICRNSGGPQGWGEVGYDFDEDYYEGSRKRCRYTCTRIDTNVTKTFESCGDDMALGDQCFGVPYAVRSLPDGSQTTMKSSPFAPGEFTHDTDLGFWTEWTDSDMVDFNDDVLDVFGDE